MFFSLKKNWWQIEIEDLDNMPGQNVVKLLKFLNDFIPFTHILTDDICGAVGEELANKQMQEALLHTKEDFYKLAIPAVQFEWGFLHLFDEKKEAGLVKDKINKGYEDKKLLSPDLTKESLITIRIVDQGYFYIYTTNKDLAELIKKEYSNAVIKNKTFKKLDFPY